MKLDFSDKRISNLYDTLDRVAKYLAVRVLEYNEKERDNISFLVEHARQTLREAKGEDDGKQVQSRNDRMESI